MHRSACQAWVIGACGRSARRLPSPCLDAATDCRPSGRRWLADSIVWFALIGTCVTAFWAVPPAARGAEPKVLLSDLADPCGIAVDPSSDSIYVSEHAAGRVVRVVGEEAEPVIVDFPLQSPRRGPLFGTGPLGLAMIGDNGLLVGRGGDAEAGATISLFRLPGPGESPVSASMPAQSLGPLAGPGTTTQAAGYFAIVFDYDTLLATARGDDRKGWIGKATAANSGFRPLEPFLPATELASVDAPTGIAINGYGHVVVSQAGGDSADADSLLAFYELKTGSLLMQLPTMLYDLVAIAYSPNGQLYGLDFARRKPEAGGLFRLEAMTDLAGRQALQATRLASLVRPTALAFRKDGALLVSTLGRESEGGERSGKLWLFPAGF